MQPDRPDERARIEAAGGRVLVVDGARVEGILATSRAIGKYFSQSLGFGFKPVRQVQIGKEQEGYTFWFRFKFFEI